MTLAQALAAAAHMGVARLDAQLLLLHALGRSSSDRAWLIAHDSDLLEARARLRFEDLCSRRAKGEPVAYLVGEKEFFGLALKVDARVLVPRPDTETLVEWALDILRVRGDATSSVIDLGTGSGAIALAIKKTWPQAQVQAVDKSPGALEVAAANASRLQLDVKFRQASWLEAGDARYDLIVSNPPYVASDDPHLGALTHEPLTALAAGAEGLDDIRVIVAQAPEHLNPGGWLLLEHGWDQAQAVRALLSSAGFQRVQSRCDLAGIERCSGAMWPELG